jgi:outer membrane lipoprotein carrier protein
MGLYGSAQAAPLPVAELLSRLESSASSTSTLAGEFTQRNRLKLFKQELRSTGRLYFEKPRRIRWEYLSPDPSKLILDGDRATLTTPGTEPQVFDLQRDPTMRAVFEQLIAWLGSGGGGALGSEYQLASGGTAEQPTLILTPRPDRPVAKAFSRIELRVDKKSGLLKSLLLVEKSGDEKEIVFRKLDRNVKLPPNAFR